MSPSVVAGIALLASRFLPHSANIKILSVAGEKYKITKLNSVNRKVLLKEKREASVYLKKTCVHKGVVVGGCFKEELETESKYGLSRQQGGWLHRGEVF